MTTSTRIVATLLVAANVLTLVGCKWEDEEAADTSTVGIANTPIENQQTASLCWAYATAAFLESINKRKFGTEINLSEEALGFYRIAEGILEQVQKSGSIAELKPRIVLDTLQANHIRDGRNWWHRLGIAIAQAGGLLPGKNPFELVRTHGVVPESAWKVKFGYGSVQGIKFTLDGNIDGVESMSQGQAAVAKIKARVIRYADSHGLDDMKKLSLDDVIREFLVSPSGPFTSEPPREFTYEGKSYTRKSFLDEKFPVDLSRFRNVAFESDSTKSETLRIVKSTLAKGIPVPLLYMSYSQALSEGRYVGDRLNPTNMFSPPPTFHVVLVTDFVNLGGREGALGGADAAARLRAEVEKPYSELYYLKIKNSWGISASTNEAGQPVMGSPTGYYSIDRQYIDKVHWLSHLDPSEISKFIFAIPDDDSVLR